MRGGVPCRMDSFGEAAIQHLMRRLAHAGVLFGRSRTITPKIEHDYSMEETTEARRRNVPVVIHASQRKRPHHISPLLDDRYTELKDRTVTAAGCFVGDSQEYKTASNDREKSAYGELPLSSSIHWKPQYFMDTTCDAMMRRCENEPTAFGFIFVADSLNEGAASSATSAPKTNVADVAQAWAQAQADRDKMDCPRDRQRRGYGRLLNEKGAKSIELVGADAPGEQRTMVLEESSVWLKKGNQKDLPPQCAQTAGAESVSWRGASLTEAPRSPPHVLAMAAAGENGDHCDGYDDFNPNGVAGDGSSWVERNHEQRNAYGHKHGHSFGSSGDGSERSSSRHALLDHALSDLHSEISLIRRSLDQADQLKRQLLGASLGCQDEAVDEAAAESAGEALRRSVAAARAATNHHYDELRASLLAAVEVRRAAVIAEIDSAAVTLEAEQRRAAAAMETARGAAIEAIVGAERVSEGVGMMGGVGGQQAWAEAFKIDEPKYDWRGIEVLVNLKASLDEPRAALLHETAGLSALLRSKYRCQQTDNTQLRCTPLSLDLPEIDIGPRIAQAVERDGAKAFVAEGSAPAPTSSAVLGASARAGRNSGGGGEGGSLTSLGDWMKQTHYQYPLQANGAKPAITGSGAAAVNALRVFQQSPIGTQSLGGTANQASTSTTNQASTSTANQASTSTTNQASTTDWRSMAQIQAGEGKAATLANTPLASLSALLLLEQQMQQTCISHQQLEQLLANDGAAQRSTRRRATAAKEAEVKEAEVKEAKVKEVKETQQTKEAKGISWGASPVHQRKKPHAEEAQRPMQGARMSLNLTSIPGAQVERLQQLQPELEKAVRTLFETIVRERDKATRGQRPRRKQPQQPPPPQQPQQQQQQRDEQSALLSNLAAAAVANNTASFASPAVVERFLNSHELIQGLGCVTTVVDMATKVVRSKMPYGHGSRSCDPVRGMVDTGNGNMGLDGEGGVDSLAIFDAVPLVWQAVSRAAARWQRKLHSHADGDPTGDGIGYGISCMLAGPNERQLRAGHLRAGRQPKSPQRPMSDRKQRQLMLLERLDHSEHIPTPLLPLLDHSEQPVLQRREKIEHGDGASPKRWCGWNEFRAALCPVALCALLSRLRRPDADTPTPEMRRDSGAEAEGAKITNSSAVVGEADRVWQSEVERHQATREQWEARVVGSAEWKAEQTRHQRFVARWGEVGALAEWEKHSDDGATESDVGPVEKHEEEDEESGEKQTTKMVDGARSENGDGVENAEGGRPREALLGRMAAAIATQMDGLHALQQAWQLDQHQMQQRQRTQQRPPMEQHMQSPLIHSTDQRMQSPLIPAPANELFAPDWFEPTPVSNANASVGIVVPCGDRLQQNGRSYLRQLRLKGCQYSRRAELMRDALRTVHAAVHDGPLELVTLLMTAKQSQMQQTQLSSGIGSFESGPLAAEESLRHLPKYAKYEAALEAGIPPGVVRTRMATDQLLTANELLVFWGEKPFQQPMVQPRPDDHGVLQAREALGEWPRVPSPALEGWKGLMASEVRMGIAGLIVSLLRPCGAGAWVGAGAGKVWGYGGWAGGGYQRAIGYHDKGGEASGNSGASSATSASKPANGTTCAARVAELIGAAGGMEALGIALEELVTTPLEQLLGNGAALRTVWREGWRRRGLSAVPQQGSTADVEEEVPARPNQTSDQEQSPLAPLERFRLKSQIVMALVGSRGTSSSGSSTVASIAAGTSIGVGTGTAGSLSLPMLERNGRVYGIKGSTYRIAQLRWRLAAAAALGRARAVARAEVLLRALALLLQRSERRGAGCTGLDASLNERRFVGGQALRRVLQLMSLPSVEEFPAVQRACLAILAQIADPPQCHRGEMLELTLAAMARPCMVADDAVQHHGAAVLAQLLIPSPSELKERAVRLGALPRLVHAMRVHIHQGAGTNNQDSSVPGLLRRIGSAELQQLDEPRMDWSPSNADRHRGRCCPRCAVMANLQFGEESAIEAVLAQAEEHMVC
jgi:hypothetical protein